MVNKSTEQPAAGCQRGLGSGLGETFVLQSHCKGELFSAWSGNFLVVISYIVGQNDPCVLFGAGVL